MEKDVGVHMVGHKIVEIGLPDLLVNPENPRFDPVSNQRQAIEQLIKEQGIKIFNLAKDIAAEGLNPSELPIVVPIEDSTQYQIMEGNRRITALKLLLTPELDDILSKKQKDKIKKIRKDIKVTLPSVISCVLYDEEVETYRWVELRHMGEQEGIGTVSWKLPQQERFRKKIGKKSQHSLAVQAVNFLKTVYDDEEIHEKLDAVPLSTLTRLLEDSNVRKVIGVEKKDGKLVTNLAVNEVAKGIKKITDDLVEGNIHVKDVYTKKDRIRYTGTFTDKDKPDRTKTTSLWKIEVYKKTSKPKPAKKGAPKPKSTDRTSLIPVTCITEIKNNKVNNLFHELRGLPVNDFPISGSVALRVILELSVDAYIKEKRIELKKGEDKLINKFNKVSEDFENNHIMTKKELRPIRRAISKETSLLNPNTLHAYVHDLIDSPSPNDLKITWDNVEKFFENIWVQLSGE